MAEISNDTINIFLIDDQSIYRTGLKTAMENYSNIVFSGDDSNGKDALMKIDKAKSDVILLSLNKPSIYEFGEVITIRKKLPATKILTLSVHNNEDYILELVRLGTMGHITKNSPPEEIYNAINSVHNHSVYYSSRHSFPFNKKQSGEVRTNGKRLPPSLLTPREIDVLKLIVNGYSNKKIAKKLSISIRTVETHREHITQKLNIKTVAGLTKYAISKGLTDVK